MLRPDEDIVMVPVPRRHLPSVYRVLADEMHVPIVSAKSDSTDGAQQNGMTASMEVWNQEGLEILYSILLEHDLQTPIAMIDLVCASPGERISFSDVREYTGQSLGVARQQLAQLTWNIKGHFGHDMWPVEVRSTGSGQVRYFTDDPNLPMKWSAAKEAKNNPN